MNRDLDGVYFRVSRNGKFVNVCFSDLEDHEMNAMLQNRSNEWLQNLCKILGCQIKAMGDKLDILGEMTEIKVNE